MHALIWSTLHALKKEKLLIGRRGLMTVRGCSDWSFYLANQINFRYDLKPSSPLDVVYFGVLAPLK